MLREDKFYAWRTEGVCLEKRKFILGEEKVYACRREGL